MSTMDFKTFVANNETIKLDTQSLVEMRLLRVHHWNGVLQHRKDQDNLERHADECQDRYTKDVLRTYAKKAKNSANFHLGAVQLLNQFFPIGDYAENDVTKR